MMYEVTCSELLFQRFLRSIDYYLGQCFSTFVWVIAPLHHTRYRHRPQSKPNIKNCGVSLSLNLLKEIATYERKEERRFNAILEVGVLFLPTFDAWLQ